MSNIRGGVILTHGFDWCVLKNLYGEVLGSSGMVTIGNNVYLGMSVTILKGVTIGDNTIIGANSLVNHDIPSNSVAAGVPARVIMSIEDYYLKRKNLQIEEARELVYRYREVYGKEPDEKALNEFFFLFDDGKQTLHPAFDYQLRQGNNYDYSLKILRNQTAPYENMDDFLKRI